jgi:hypothetical protein
MIDRDLAKSEIRKFSTLAFPPSEVQGIALLIDTLAKNAVSEKHLADIMEDLLSNPPRERDTGIARWPDAALIVAAAKRTKPPQVDTGCSLCNSSGWLYAPFMRYDKFAGREIEHSGVERCSCNPPPVAASQEPEKRGGLTKASAAMFGKDWE